MATVEQGCLFVKDEVEGREEAQQPVRAPASACAAGARTGGGAALGTLTKSFGHKFEVIDQETGEIQGFTVKEGTRECVPAEPSKEEAVRAARVTRMMLGRSARKLMKGYVTPLGKPWRVVGCTWRRTARMVSIYKTCEHSWAHFRGLMICGSVWTCPGCAAKISEARREEVGQAFDSWEGRGVEGVAEPTVYMLTLTFSHSRTDDVAELVKRLRLALVKLRQHRDYRALQRWAGFEGLIRALEVTHGEANGWHPHVHELWFMENKLTDVMLRLLRRDLFRLWHTACGNAGLALPNRKHGLKFEKAQLSSYVAKWGADRELTQAHSKKGRGESSTPFDLLRRYGEGDERAGKLFATFASAFYGSRQLFWSPGLKAKFGIEEVSDEEHAERQEVESVLVTMLTADEWRAVRSEMYEARALVLELAESGGRDAVREFVASLFGRDALREFVSRKKLVEHSPK